MSEDIYKFRIPEELYGQVIDGIDLQILSSDSVRLIEAYINQEGELSDIQKRVLLQCARELAGVIPKTDGDIKKYFVQVQQAVAGVIEKLALI